MRSDHYGLQREDAHGTMPDPWRGGDRVRSSPRPHTRAPRRRRNRDEYPSGDGNPLRGPSHFLRKCGMCYVPWRAQCGTCLSPCTGMRAMITQVANPTIAPRPQSAARPPFARPELHLSRHPRGAAPPVTGPGPCRAGPGTPAADTMGEQMTDQSPAAVGTVPVPPARLEPDVIGVAQTRSSAWPRPPRQPPSG